MKNIACRSVFENYFFKMTAIEHSSSSLLRVCPTRRRITSKDVFAALTVVTFSGAQMVFSRRLLFDAESFSSKSLVRTVIALADVNDESCRLRLKRRRNEPCAAT